MSFSAALLILANSIPLLGVLFWGWDTVLVLALFWIENLIIGVFNVIKMGWVGIARRQAQSIFLIVFFSFHYGAFCSVHGQLLADLLGQDVNAVALLGFKPEGLSGLFLDALAVLLHFIETLSPAIWLGLTGLLLSRTVSFVEHFLLRGEAFTADSNQLMMQPYKQIVVMHVGLIVGAMLLQKLGSPTWLLAILVIGKMLVDYWQFSKRHTSATRLAE